MAKKSEKEDRKKTLALLAGPGPGKKVKICGNIIHCINIANDASLAV